ncbi:adenosylmethionine decarboxylase [Patescibacteria group bacterium]|nr:adenosylmethionine decarboxylase [Patescibacteria group bacterium]
MSNSTDHPVSSLAPTTTKFGEHLIFDAYNCDPKKLDDMEFCRDLLEELVKITGLHKLTEPCLVRADSNEALGGKDPGGISCFVMIMESHISLHTFTRRGFLTLDVYSCKTFNTEGIVEYLSKAFNTTDFSIVKFDRGLKYPTENIY